MEIINPSGGSEFETQPGRGNKKQERPWIGDLPGKGSEGPTDIPNKDDYCPHCGTPHKGGVRKDNPVQKPQNPLSTPGQYRGEQQGRGGHFDAGHQKVTPEWASSGKGSPPNRWPVGSSNDRPKYSPAAKQHMKDRQAWTRKTGQAPSDEQVPPPSGLSWE